MAGKNEERDREIWRLHVQGMSQAKIGQRFGIGQPSVSHVIQRMRGRIPRVSREELRADLAEQLHEVRARMHRIMDMEGAPLVKVGTDPEGGTRVVYVRDPETAELVRDYGAQIKAADQIVRTQTRLAQLMGADDPVRVETTGTVRYEIVGVNTEDLT